MVMTEESLDAYLVGPVGETYPEVHSSVLYVDDVVTKYIPKPHPTAKFIDYTVTGYDKVGEAFPATHTLVPLG